MDFILVYDCFFTKYVMAQYVGHKCEERVRIFKIQSSLPDNFFFKYLLWP